MIQNPVSLVPVTPPEPSLRVRRNAQPAAEGEKRNRYTLPALLKSGSPVGYRTRVSLTPAEGAEAAALFAIERPVAFEPGPSVRESELFDEVESAP